MREKILKHIEKNSRIDLADLAVMLDMPEAEVLKEIEAMENEHIICGYNTMIDWDKVGTEKVTALIEVRVTPQRGMGFDKVAERIYRYPEVKIHIYGKEEVRVGRKMGHITVTDQTIEDALFKAREAHSKIKF